MATPWERRWKVSRAYWDGKNIILRDSNKKIIDLIPLADFNEVKQWVNHNIGNIPIYFPAGVDK